MATNYQPQRRQPAKATHQSSNIINISDRYPLQGGRRRYAYVSQFYSERYQQTYVNVDIREYTSIDQISDSECWAKPTIKGVSLNAKEFEELLRILPTLKEDLENKLAEKSIADTVFEIKNSMPQPDYVPSLHSLQNNSSSKPTSW